MIKNCYMRHKNGNCLPAGGFCTANKSICEALHNAYEMGKSEQRIGKWIKKHRHYGGFRSYTGFDAMGEQHTVTVDERTEYDDLYCSECGARSADNFLNFCPNCGLKMVVVNDEEIM